jgi:glucose-6-phosphate isomerase
MISFQFMDAMHMTNLANDKISPIREKAEKTLAHLKNLPNTLPLIKRLNDDLTEIEAKAEVLKKFDDVVILGTGGSSLAGQAITALRTTIAPRLHFLDNIDSYTFSQTLEKLDKIKTGIIAISKSGNTAETLMQLLTCIQLWDQSKLKEQFLIVCENTNNAIREVAKKYDISCLDHPNDVGGRFSAFTVVGMLPAFIAGMDAKAFRQGAIETVDMLKASTLENCAPLIGASIQTVFARQNINQSIMFVYSDRLQLFASWYCQLWAESLGKKNKQNIASGTTPVRALGTVDQHSQLQLYLGGPKDKFFTFITLENQPPLPALSLSGFEHPAIMTLGGKKMGDLMIAEQRATIDTMRNQSLPLRQLQIKELDVTNLGALMMHFILETIAAAELQEVDPFDQPAVEDGKKLALEYLKAA